MATPISAAKLQAPTRSIPGTSNEQRLVHQIDLVLDKPPLMQ
jgi:hypothetical protein